MQNISDRDIKALDRQATHIINKRQNNQQFQNQIEQIDQRIAAIRNIEHQEPQHQPKRQFHIDRISPLQNQKNKQQSQNQQHMQNQNVSREGQDIHFEDIYQQNSQRKAQRSYQRFNQLRQELIQNDQSLLQDDNGNIIQEQLSELGSRDIEYQNTKRQGNQKNGFDNQLKNQQQQFQMQNQVYETADFYPQQQSHTNANTNAQSVNSSNQNYKNLNRFIMICFLLSNKLYSTILSIKIIIKISNYKQNQAIFKFIFSLKKNINQDIQFLGLNIIGQYLQPTDLNSVRILNKNNQRNISSQNRSINDQHISPDEDEEQYENQNYHEDFQQRDYNFDNLNGQLSTVMHKIDNDQQQQQFMSQDGGNVLSTGQAFNSMQMMSQESQQRHFNLLKHQEYQLMKERESLIYGSQNDKNIYSSGAGNIEVLSDLSYPISVSPGGENRDGSVSIRNYQTIENQSNGIASQRHSQHSQRQSISQNNASQFQGKNSFIQKSSANNSKDLLNYYHDLDYSTY